MKFREWEVEINFASYGNGRISITMVDELQYPIATCTVNVPKEELTTDEVCIKDYSENEGMLDWLVKNEVVYEPHRYVQSGYIKIPVCKLRLRSSQK